MRGAEPPIQSSAEGGTRRRPGRPPARPTRRLRVTQPPARFRCLLPSDGRRRQLPDAGHRAGPRRPRAERRDSARGPGAGRLARERGTARLRRAGGAARTACAPAALAALGAGRRRRRRPGRVRRRLAEAARLPRRRDVPDVAADHRLAQGAGSAARAPALVAADTWTAARPRSIRSTAFAADQSPIRSAPRSPATSRGACAPRSPRSSPKLRDTLLLASSGEHSYEEIAAMLGIPLGTVKWRVSEARRLVRELDRC